MNSITVSFLAGLIIGSIIMWVIMRYFRASPMRRFQETQHEVKEERKHMILAYLKEKKSITNNQVEMLLGISDASATKYLQELEDEEKITQIGKEGSFVHYELKK